MKDYTVYIDTDSLYIQINQWLIDNNVNIEEWNALPQEEQLNYVELIAKEVETYVNKHSLKETQLLHYNSRVTDFGIVFEQEKIAFTALFKMKKRYSTWTLKEDGEWKDDISITGLEIIRSDSPEIVKPMVKSVLKMILKEEKDDNIRQYIVECMIKLKKCSATEIAENKGIKNIQKYQIKKGTDIKIAKGTPHHVKGAINFNFITKELGIDSKYEAPRSGNKAKVVYVKKNPFGVTSLSFIEWPDEFEKHGIQVDYNKMIENNFTKKVKGLLEIIGKEDLCNANSVVGDLFL